MVKKIILITLAMHVVFGALSSWRAWVQVRSLDLRLAGRVLRGGSAARVLGNREPFWDPRTRPASTTVVFTPAVLSHFTAGPLLVRELPMMIPLATSSSH